MRSMSLDAELISSPPRLPPLRLLLLLWLPADDLAALPPLPAAAGVSEVDVEEVRGALLMKPTRCANPKIPY